ncbi:Cytosolic sulfotransferase 5 [Linum perenne]
METKTNFTKELAAEDVDKLGREKPSWGVELSEIQGFWYETSIIDSIATIRANFKPKRDDDIVILASTPKTGTTWLKALSHCILFRDEEDDLLAKKNPHLCVRNLESGVDKKGVSSSHMDSEGSRLFSTHIAYSYLPISIKQDCKLVYITRDPKDTFVSQWHFFNKIFRALESAAEIFCNGTHTYGPYWDHVLEYWEASQRSPDKVMFMKYEDLRCDPKPRVRELALFLGKPFGDDDDVEIEEVIWRSSFDRLKDLDVNKTGKVHPVLSPLLTNNLFFRRGEVGDWRNHLTPEVAKRIDDVTRVKFRSCGLYLHEEETS